MVNLNGRNSGLRVAGRETANVPLLEPPWITAITLWPLYGLSTRIIRNHKIVWGLQNPYGLYPETQRLMILYEPV